MERRARWRVTLGVVLAVAVAGPVLAEARGAGQAATAWTTQQVPLISGEPPVLYAVAAASNRVVWAAGSRAPANVALTTEVIKTLDGGQTWFVQHRAPDCCEARDIEAASSTDLWLVRATPGGGAQVLGSRDAGDSWSIYVNSATPLWAVAAGSARRAWAVGSLGRVRYTADGSVWGLGTTATAAALWATTAGSETVGWAVGDDGTVLKTTDGGQTWSAQPSGVFTTLLGVSAGSADIAWAVGLGGLIVKTTDGGATWRTQSSGVTADLVDVVAVSPTTAWAVAGVEGGPTHIIGTSDGGATWTVQYQAASSGSPRRVGGIAAASPYAAWVVGTSRIVATTSAPTASRQTLAFVVRGLSG